MNALLPEIISDTLSISSMSAMEDAIRAMPFVMVAQPEILGMTHIKRAGKNVNVPGSLGQKKPERDLLWACKLPAE